MAKNVVLHLNNPINKLLAALKLLYVKIQAVQLAKAVRLVQEEMLKHRAYRETYNSLSKLSDAELNDIGLSRGEIHYVAMKTCYEDSSTNPNLRNWV